ncbi:hypothetical protein [uncultured Ruminococcus sp.]|uniref:hypothetical protein n=1 Tax=uncultured Ruminococcus sp. TaxID=165186 RepID=UPI0025DEB30A|nr:hypothetical protein [uncultured Ruminococcus sp.]
MYKFVVIISYWIRTFYLPNPFEKFGKNIMIPMGMFEFPIPTNAINILFGSAVLVPFTFWVVGIFYDKGEDRPIKGSILFLLFYALHNGLVYLASLADFAWWAIIGSLLVYLVVLFALLKLVYKLRNCGLVV